MINYFRGNCEAIPEEFSGAGTTPPQNETVQPKEVSSNPSLSSIHLLGNENSPGPGATISLSSFSFEEVNPQSEEKKLGNTFFDQQNENFEFNRSASVSQVRNGTLLGVGILFIQLVKIMFCIGYSFCEKNTTTSFSHESEP